MLVDDVVVAVQPTAPGRTGVGEVRVTGRQVGVYVVQPVRVADRPGRRGGGGRGQGDGSQGRGGQRQAGPRGEPPGQRVGEQPAAVGEGEAGGEGGGQVRVGGGAADHAAAGRQDGRAGGPDRRPRPQERGPGPGAGGGGGEHGDGGEDHGEAGGGPEHHGAVGGAPQEPRQGECGEHGPRAVRAEGDRDRPGRAVEVAADGGDGVHEDDGSAGGDRQVEGEQGPQPRSGPEQAGAESGLGVDPAGPLDGGGPGQRRRGHERGGGEEPADGAGEQPVVGDDGEQRRGQDRAEQALQVVGEPAQRQGPGVVPFVGQDLGDRGLEGRGGGRRSRLQQEDQDVDLPHLGDEGQGECHAGAGEVRRHHEDAPGHPVGDGRHQRRDGHIGDHLDRQRGAEDRRGAVAGEVVREQAQRDGGEAGADQGDDLGGEQAAVGAVAQNRRQRRHGRYGSRGGRGRHGRPRSGRRIDDTVPA